MQWLYDLLVTIVDFIVELALYVPRWIFQEFCGLLELPMNLIQGPIAAIGAFENTMNQIPEGVLWFLSVMQFQFGLATILAALLARFLLKFIPTLGF